MNLFPKVNIVRHVIFKLLRAEITFCYLLNIFSSYILCLTRMIIQFFVSFCNEQINHYFMTNLFFCKYISCSVLLELKRILFYFQSKRSRCDTEFFLAFWNIILKHYSYFNKNLNPITFSSVNLQLRLIFIHVYKN